MKKLSYLLVLAMCLFVVSACSNQGGSGSSDKVQLKLNMEPGQVFKSRVSTDQDIVTSAMGMDVTVKQSMEFFTKMEVESVAEGGEPDATNPMAMGMAPMVNKSFTMILSERGEVVDIQGFDKLLEAVEESMGVDMSGQPGLDAESMKKTMQSSMVMFPEVLVGEGDSWGAESETAGQYALSMQTTYEVEKVEADKIYLNVDGTLESAEGAEIPGGMGEMEMEGTQGGTLVLDRKSGMPTSGELIQDVEGEVSAMGMSMPMTINSKITMGTYD